ncbi:hypothetical protein POM88_021961 [Heracleum sosnowskyi]|uniref:Cytochrome c oxidase polypeptide II n=1 Tax=Heracleum sosnowskyi TaxID=360622 RepID=A0AAD8MT13_9APIA|nr:hypothetical protein POM88_021961 [Heracleum sosnowskyi]
MAKLVGLSLTAALDFLVVFHFEGITILEVQPGEMSSTETGSSMSMSGLTRLVFKGALDFLIFFCFGEIVFFLRVGVESFLRGNLQVQFGGRRASTQPYEYSDYNSSDEQSLTFDSYTIPEDDPELGQSRLLEVDNRVVVSAKTHLRVYSGQCSEICGTNHAFTRALREIGRLLSPLWLSRTTQGASHPRSKLLQRAAGAVWSRGAKQ